MYSASTPKAAEISGAFHWVADIPARQAPAEKPIRETRLGSVFHSLARSRASLDLYRQWVKDGKKLSVERLTELACRLISYGYKGLLK